jgi:threonine/homoserine/homoserine lactone efflux protein
MKYICPDFPASTSHVRELILVAVASELSSTNTGARMIDAHHLALFLAAALMLAATPGPGMLYVLARTVAGGRREGVLSALGTFIGGLVHVLAAAVGLSAILATSALAFSVVKYAGAAYLVFLGVRMIARAGQEEPLASERPQPRSNPFRQGVLTEVLNPKTALFFLSFIPQFVVRQNGNVFLQFAVLGASSVTLNTLADIVVVSLAGQIGGRLRTSMKLRIRQRRATGCVMIALGAYVAVSDAK